MSDFIKGNSPSEMAGLMAGLFAFLGSELAFSILDFNYQLFSDSFDILSFSIHLGTLLSLYFIGLKFFTWLYPKVK